MKNLKFELVAYASAFTSFVIPKIPDVKEIILFGSSARGDAREDSDIDIFFNIGENSPESAQKIIESELKKFYKSKIAETFFLKGIKNEISAKAGNLDKWKLKRSIVSDGITLYGKYKELPKNLKALAFFSISPIKNIAKRNRVVRELFGRTEKEYSKQGLIQKFSGKKLSPSSFIIPLENSNEIAEILSKEKIDFIFFDIWSDSL